jgi:class 3 adenylate cyclase/predicted ATPase
MTEVRVMGKPADVIRFLATKMAHKYCHTMEGIVEEWLKEIGLSERAAAFGAHGITLDDVGDLSEEDFRELGLTIGERKRLRRAVAALLKRRRPSAQPRRAIPVLAKTRAERRPLTVMFVDLVNSSGLAEQLEQEDLLELIRRYREICGTAIMRYGGLIARFAGDGILSYFCYPVANENDPERAVRAALDIVVGTGELATPAGAAVHARIGIATGRVIVSDLFAGGEAELRSIIGSTPNLAARLQEFAPPDGIMIANETQARVRSLFLYDDFGERTIRGFREPHRIWRVIGRAPRDARNSLRRQVPRLTPFYGRQAELDILTERWHRACGGKRAVVLVAGEAGIGKSRLVEQFLATGIGGDARILDFAAKVFDENSPLQPLISGLRAAVQLDPKDSPETQRDKLAALLMGEPDEHAAALRLLGRLIGIPSDEPTPKQIPPVMLREQLLSTIVRQIALLSAHQPVCLIVEDVHWLDPTSRELLDRIVTDIKDHRLMVLLTTRDAFEAPWISSRDTTVLRLVPLSSNDVVGMVESLFRGRLTPPSLGHIIARRTDGVPLFVEEVALSLLQAQVLPNDDYRLDTVMQSIPASLHETLTARLDRSGAKEVAQIAAVIGRSVRSDVLGEVAGIKPAALKLILKALTDSGVLTRSASTGILRFSHELLRDAAYDSLLRDHRQQLHARVARALQVLDPETVAQRPEVLALHLAEGGQLTESVNYWLEAGRRSLAHSALTEATHLLRRGLSILEKLPPSEANKRLRLQFSGLLGPALIGLRGPGSAEAQELYNSAYAICCELPEGPSHFPILWGWWRVSRELRVKKDRAGVLLARAVARNDPEFLLQAHHCNWAAEYVVGNYHACYQHIQTALGIYNQGDFRHHARLYGNHDAKVCGLGALSQILWIQGKPISGLAQERRAVEWADHLDHLGSRFHSMDVSLLHRAERREHDRVYELAGDLISFASQYAMIDHRAKGLIFRGWAIAMREDAQAGLKMLRDGLARQHEFGTVEDFPLYVCLLAEALMRAGSPEQAAEELARAQAEFERAGLQFWMPEVLRLRAICCLQIDPHAGSVAQTLLEQASETAEAQGAMMLAVRIAVTRAQMGDRLAGIDTASRLLDAALSRISEHDGCPDLMEAHAASERLRERLSSVPSRAFELR